jgi:hypothetical protein
VIGKPSSQTIGKRKRKAADQPQANLPALNHLVLAQTFQPSRPEKTGITSLPSDLVVLILERADPMALTCLALTSKWFALHCLSLPKKTTFPSKHGKYADDARRITFMNLLSTWVPSSKYRLCHICRTYRPINDGELPNLVEEDYTEEEIPMHKRFGIRLKKKVWRTSLWQDEDWTFVSLGKRVTKNGLMQTRGYCPACVREVESIHIGRKKKKWVPREGEGPDGLQELVNR